MNNTDIKPWDYGPLSVTPNHRYFRNGEKPFFLLADTAWLFFHSLTLEESYRYLRNRKELGFNCILADFLHSPEQKNLAGASALINEDLTRPNTDGGFWDHVDSCIKMAADMGLYMGILPTWGSVVKDGALREDNADAWLDFILARYHDAPNLIWVLGGDVRGDVNPELYRHMGLRMKTDRPDRLITYHPFGRTCSSNWFQNEEWLDFHLFQSGHRRYDQVTLNEWDDNTAREGWFGEDNWRYVARDYNREPLRPILDGEPSYEQIPQGLHDPSQPRWLAADVRRYAYWSVFEGAAGHVYGHNSIMQFYRDKTRPGSYNADTLWSEAVHHPGGAQMGHLKRLMESVDFSAGRPAPEALFCEQKERYERISVYAGTDFLFAYTYTSRTISLSLEAWKNRTLSAYWMSPVTGRLSYIRTVSGGGVETFVPPLREDSTDIVLALYAEWL
ncbi:MAG: glycoside hydrolase family 140 protein [Lachnospiraceae bacterium]|nr:glycoside hydrolase family 140 protein [Lachnospiraceae bacterium]